ncbi:MAG: 30S ribosomal protein S3 [Nanoarchaeales archaeon]|nr:30S ribosomal protein S3 [Nanoarchaeales archaeon]
MIERKIIQAKLIEYKITEFVKSQSADLAVKAVTFEKNPIGERITIYTSTPGLVIGREGSNIKKLTIALKKEFKFENPQIKIGEVKEAYLSAPIVAKMIANDLARFGSQKFKLSGFKSLTRIMDAGAMGCEIKISGKLPSSRAKSWRFHKGYLKKTGYVSDFLVDKGVESVTLKTGVVGIKVQIMLPGTPLPDKIVFKTEVVAPVTAEAEKVAIVKEEVKADSKTTTDVKSEEVKEVKKVPAKKAVAKKTTKTSEVKTEEVKEK